MRHLLFGRRRVLVALLLAWFAPLADAATAHVAVASNFAGAMERIARAFEANSSHRVTLSTGSSGRIVAQIQRGAPYDLFLSADQAKPAALEQQGRIVADSRFTYAVGALALWSPRPGFVDDGPARLRSGEFNKLALANPTLAPYGQAAVEVLEALGLREATEAKWVRGENIAHAYQFVSTGNADLGFVALSQLLSDQHEGAGSTWVVPPALYRPIRQDAVLLERGVDNPAARALLEFLRGDTAAQIMAGLGYTKP